MSAGQKPRVALIGLGGVGELHLGAYRTSNDIDIVACAEPNAARRATLLAGTGIPGFHDHRALLDSSKPDIACVLTPAASHEGIVVDCARAGIHVLCEKPIALSLDAVARMRCACDAAGVRFGYGASYRFLPAIRAARELIRSGTIGRVRLLREEVLGGRGEANWQALPPHHYPTGGPGGSGMGLMDHGIHLIDAFRWFTGQDVIRVTGRGSHSGAPPRTEHLHMDFADGAEGLLIYNDATYPTTLPGAGLFAEGSGWDGSGYVPAGSWSATPGSIEVFGSTGSLRIFHYANLVFLFGAHGVQRIPVTGRPSPAHFATQIEAFADSVRTGGDVPVSLADGANALAVALAAYESDAEGRTIALANRYD